MPVAPGTRFGPYEISAQIGEGGMGEVYRATDGNLSRQVAIKVLPHTVASDADRLARFDREAKTLAALNHPNIAAIYGLERSDGTTALVMELVEGPTLADRILQGAIPVDEAIRIAREIADALAAAHEQGIVHRDLKPANIKQHRTGTDARLELEEAHAAPERTVTDSARRVPWLWTAIASVVLVAIIAGASRMSSASSVTMPTARLSFVPDPRISADAAGVLAMSPDGRHIAYIAGKANQIYVRDIDSFDARALPQTEGADLMVFSPDGKWIAFQANEKVKKIALAGGAPITLAESAEGHGLGWESNETILFGPGRASPIWRIAASGGLAQVVTTVQRGENSHQEPDRPGN